MTSLCVWGEYKNFFTCVCRPDALFQVSLCVCLLLFAALHCSSRSRSKCNEFAEATLLLARKSVRKVVAAGAAKVAVVVVIVACKSSWLASEKKKKVKLDGVRLKHSKHQSLSCFLSLLDSVHYQSANKDQLLLLSLLFFSSQLPQTNTHKRKREKNCLNFAASTCTLSNFIMPQTQRLFSLYFFSQAKAVTAAAAVAD